MRSFWRTLDQATLRGIALVCLADGVVGVSFGAISVSGGLRPWVPVTLSVLVFAGGAQFAAVGVVLGGGGTAAAAVLAGLLVNTRFLPYGFAVADVVEGRWWTRLLGAHFVIDESVAFAVRQQAPRQRRAAFWACGLALFACWNAAVALGALAGSSLRDPSALGLDTAFPVVLLALVMPSLADRATRNAALAGAALAVAATPFLPAGLPVLLALAGVVLVVRRGLPAEERAVPAPAAREDDPCPALEVD